MRSIPLLAAITVIAFGAWSCGDDDGGVGTNQDPDASFVLPASCAANTPCVFTDNSSDPEGVNTITTRHWNFGDQTEVDNPGLSPSHTYAADGTYSVSLTVTDNAGNTNTETQSLTVGGGTGGLAPIASMDLAACTGLACTFHSTSTDDGLIVTTNWNFGDLNSGASNTATGIDAQHTFSAAGTYTVTLTVTDDEGLSSSATQSVTVGAAQGQDCTASGTTDVTCTITLTQNSTVTITLESEDCEIGGNSVLIPPPGERAQSVFFNVCNAVTPQDRQLVNDAGAPMVFPAGTQLPIVFRRGSDPVAGTPAARFTNESTNNWTISVDDGGNPGGPGEPDFADVILTVVATPQ